jgi:hypothetical protein
VSDLLVRRFFLVGVLTLCVGCHSWHGPDWEIDDWRVQYMGCKVKVRSERDEPNRQYRPASVRVKCKRKVSWLGT